MRIHSIFISLIFLIGPAFGDILRPGDITSSSAQFYPQILEAYQSIKATQSRVQQAEGNFDTVITNSTYTRPKGFYDGNLIDSRISQPLRDNNATIYSGYRISDGQFPIYEDERFTEDNGELYVGVKLSLLRDRLINKNLAKLSISELKVLEEQTKLRFNKLNIQRKSLQSYWSWVIAGHQFFAFKDLLDLAETRQKNLKKQVKAGQIAKVYLQENQQYILKRLADFNIAQMRLRTTAQDLSLYYRNHKGTPIIPTIAMLPPRIDPHYDAKFDDATQQIYNHPIFKIIATQKDILQQKLDLADNDLMPYVDLDLKAARDFGSGSETLDETELIAILQFKLPLQRNIAKADRSFAKAKISALAYKEKFQLEKLKIAVNKLLVTLRNQDKFLEVTKKELELAKQMSKLEETRFKNGISDFFTLNKREEDMMHVRIKRLEAQETLFKLQEELRAITASLRPEFEAVPHEIPENS